MKSDSLRPNQNQHSRWSTSLGSDEYVSIDCSNSQHALNIARSAYMSYKGTDIGIQQPSVREINIAASAGEDGDSPEDLATITLILSVFSDRRRDAKETTYRPIVITKFGEADIIFDKDMKMVGLEVIQNESNMPASVVGLDFDGLEFYRRCLGRKDNNPKEGTR